MAYAEIKDVKTRSKRIIDNEDGICEALLEDAAIIIDSYNKNASDEAKKLVSCNMVLRAIGDGDTDQVLVGATQGTVSALGYSQTWSMANGSARELYLSKTDKKILGSGQKIKFLSPIEMEG